MAGSELQVILEALLFESQVSQTKWRDEKQLRFDVSNKFYSTIVINLLDGFLYVYRLSTRQLILAHK